MVLLVDDDFKRDFMKAYSFFLSLFIMLPLAGCNDGSSSESSSADPVDGGNHIVWEVDNHKSVVGEAFFDTLRLRVREPGASDWKVGYHISNFDYEWGYNYTVKVKTVKVDPSLADAPSVDYHLVEVLDKQRAQEGVYFNIEVGEPQWLVKTDVEQVYEVYGEKFSCELAMCEAIDSLMQQELSVDLMFTHSTDSSVPLIAKQINCSAPWETFGEECFAE